MKMGITLGAAVLVLLLLLGVSVLGAPSEAAHVPGGEVHNEDELKTALGGEIYIKEKTVTMKRDLALDAPLVLSGTDYILNGAGSTLSRGEAQGDMIVLKDGAKLLLGKEKREGSDTLLTVDGKGTESGRLFSVSGDSVLTMNAGVILCGGGDGAVLCGDRGAFEMKDGEITGCAAREYGGAVLVRDGGVFTLVGGELRECSAKFGGAIAVIGGTAGFAGGTVTGCTAADFGGGMYLDGTAVFGPVTVTLCTAEKGGGLYLVSCPEIGGGTVSENSATLGGGVYAAGNELAIAKLGIESNRAERGGGLYNEGTLTLGDVYIDKNIATERGGGFFNTGNVTFLAAMVANNECPVAAGIWNEGEILSQGCSVMTNRGEIGIGGVNAGKLTLIGSSYFSPRNVLCVAVNLGEGKGAVTFQKVLNGEMPCFAPVTVDENGVTGYDYKTKMPLVLGEAADVAKVCASAQVRPDGVHQYVLTSGGTLREKLPVVPLIAGGAAVLAAAGITAALLIRKKKKKS